MPQTTTAHEAVSSSRAHRDRLAEELRAFQAQRRVIEDEIHRRRKAIGTLNALIASVEVECNVGQP